MKIKLNDYEIEIKAKDSLLNEDKKYNKQDTLLFLNWLSFTLNSAANYQESLTCHAIAKDMREEAKSLYNLCQEKGLYKTNNK